MASAINPVDFAFFSTVASSPSLAGAARELGLTTAAVSKRLTLMEARLGLALVNRTTRRMSLTPEGELYLERARSLLAEVEDLESALRGSTQKPQGLLRINATLGFGRSYVAPAVSNFVEQYPAVTVQLQLSVAPPALSEDAYDVCLRFGAPPDARVVARFVARNRRILCASPAYLKRHCEPKTPQDLVNHSCIDIRQGEEYGVWRFAHSRHRRDGQTVRIKGNLATNDGAVAVAWALAGPRNPVEGAMGRRAVHRKGQPRPRAA